jgi:hypothetical protein
MVLPRSGNEAGSLSTSGHGAPPPVATLPPPPIEVISGGMLCRLKIWNDREWAQLTEEQKPREFAHVPGLGWVGAVPVAGLN